jgi:hypothetical protein
VTAPKDVGVFLCGEGPSELGSRSGHTAFQTDQHPGALQELLARVQPSGWRVGGARQWKSIRKFRAGGAKHADTLNVLGAALDAKDAGCDVLAFIRDSDRDVARGDAVEDGIRRAPAAIVGVPAIIGGVAVPTLEGWLLALLGEKRSETLSPRKAEEHLVARGVRVKDAAAIAAVVAAANLAKIPSDAASLSRWLTRARAVLPAAVAARGPAPAPARRGPGED